MEYLEILLIALAMSIDAFSVALGVGCGRGCNRGAALRLSTAFGLFQFIMPLLGAVLGLLLEKYFFGTKYLAAGILFFIAFRFVRDARKEKEEDCLPESDTRGLGLLILALATSMDAFAIGIPISVMQTPIVAVASFIGLVTFGVTYGGVFVGGLVKRYVGKAEYIGAGVLAVIGIRLVLF